MDKKPIHGNTFITVQGLVWALWPGNFPQHDVFQKANWTQTALGGHVGNWMDVVEYIFTGGARKREEMSAKNVDQGIFCRCCHARKNNCLAGMVEGGREGKRWGISINLGVYRESMDVCKNIMQHN